MYLPKLSNIFVQIVTSICPNCQIVRPCLGEILNQEKNTLIDGTGVAPRNLGHFTRMKSAFVDNGKVPTCPFWVIPTPVKANTFANTGPVFQVLNL